MQGVRNLRVASSRKAAEAARYLGVALQAHVEDCNIEDPTTKVAKMVLFCPPPPSSSIPHSSTDLVRSC